MYDMPKPRLTEIIGNIVVIDTKRGFWGKETKLLKGLIEKYPDLDFWKKLRLPEKLASLAQLYAYPFDEILRQRYRDFHMTFAKDQEIILSDKKFGKDIIKKPKPKTLRNFLNG